MLYSGRPCQVLGDDKQPANGCGQGHVTHFKFLGHDHAFSMGEATVCRPILILTTTSAYLMYSGSRDLLLDLLYEIPYRSNFVEHPLIGRFVFVFKHFCSLSFIPHFPVTVYFPHCIFR